MINVLLTSGGTKVPIDSVRSITNMSNGTFGARLAREYLLDSSVHLTFLRAEGSKSPFIFTSDIAAINTCSELKRFDEMISFHSQVKDRYKEITYRTYNDYSSKLIDLLKGQIDVIVLAAAVSDYGVDAVDGKVRSNADLTITLKPLPKVIEMIHSLAPNATLVGFKLMVQADPIQLNDAAARSCIKNKCKFVVANDLRDIQNGNHSISIVNDDYSFTPINPRDGGDPVKAIVSLSLGKKIEGLNEA